MEWSIALTNYSGTGFRFPGTPKLFVDKLLFKGSGKLDSCIVTFKNKEDHTKLYSELLFVTEQPQKPAILHPHIKNFEVQDYNFCTLELLNGTLFSSDEITLLLRHTSVV